MMGKNKAISAVVLNPECDGGQRPSPVCLAWSAPSTEALPILAFLHMRGAPITPPTALFLHRQ